MSTGERPILSLMYNTCNSYKDTHLIYVGGMSIQKDHLKKFFNPHVYVFNVLLKEWTHFNWGKYMRQHASCIVGGNVIVHGGIDER